MYKKRHLQSKLAMMAKHFKIILITGARQTGKTTLLQEVFPSTTVVTFDPKEDVHNARKDPNLFLKLFDKTLILDEIQYAPELVSVLKRVVDKNQSPGQYFLTGSHNLNTLSLVTESLAGRVGILNLAPMTTYEQRDYVQFDENNEQTPPLWLSYYLQDPSLLITRFAGTTGQNVLHALWRGGLPGTLTIPDALIPEYFSSYLQAYLERDVNYLNMVMNMTAFRQFVGVAASLTGQEINPTELGREVGVERKTILNWYSLLSATYHWNEIPPYSSNMIKRVVSKKQKGYFSDTGLVCYLLRITDPESLMSYPFRGSMFETLVVNSIRSMLSSLQAHPALHYWRTRNDAEVDLILESNGALYPMEIKMKGSLSGHDTSGLRAFRAAYRGDLEIKTGLIIYAGSECYWFDENTIALPWNAICR